MHEVSCLIVFSSAHTNCGILCCTIVLQLSALCISGIVIGVYECSSFNIYEQTQLHRLELLNVHPWVCRTRHQTHFHSLMRTGISTMQHLQFPSSFHEISYFFFSFMLTDPSSLCGLWVSSIGPNTCRQAELIWEHIYNTKWQRHLKVFPLNSRLVNLLDDYGYLNSRKTQKQIPFI